MTSGGFGRQIRNLYDALACNDILDLRVALLEYNGWDSHKNQKAMIEPKLEDMFGDDKAFDTLYSELPDDAKRKLTIVVSGEFGRQLRANGDNGTDHGRGNAIIVIGEQVRGGVCGDMFPASELSRLGGSSPDITGLTEIDHVFGAVCDWVQPGVGNTVFPRRQRATPRDGRFYEYAFRVVTWPARQWLLATVWTIAYIPRSFEAHIGLWRGCRKTTNSIARGRLAPRGEQLGHRKAVGRA